VDLLVILMESLTNQMMHPSDEIIWEQEGLFDKIDLLSARIQTFPAKSSLSNKPFSTPFPTLPTSEDLDRDIPTADGTRSPLLSLPAQPPVQVKLKAPPTAHRVPAG
jgi:hypothetical protein